MKIKSAGQSYFEHWRDDMQTRYDEFKSATGADDLDAFRAWHQDEHGHCTTFGSWMRNEAHKLEVHP